jgi:AraC-like DNA-binding protein
MDTSVPVVSCRLIDDVDAMATVIADGHQAEYVQMERGAFGCRWSVISSPGVVLQFAHEGIANARRLRVAANRWAIVVPLNVADTARWDARPVKHDEMIVCGPASESYAFDPGGTSFALISVPARSSTAAAARDLMHDDAATRTVRPSARDARSLHHRLRAIDAAVERAGAVADPRLVAGIDAAMAECLTRAVLSDWHTKERLRSSQIVKCAEAFFRQHVDESISIAQLSAIAGVSERGLRNAFYDVYQTSPKRYLRQWRLHRVRHALRATSSSLESVTAVATRHGLYELGRFAVEYRALFGEPPSHTLYRARSQNASGACLA